MELDECIHRERATRAFTDETPPDPELLSLIDLARHAGSGHNRQPWEFLISRDRETLDELATFGAYTTPLRNAPVGIFLFLSESDYPYAEFDCGRVAQNLMLAAVSRGIGTVPQGFSEDREGAEAFLDVPSGTNLLIGFAVGYPADEHADHIEGTPKAEELPSIGRADSAELVHWEQWEDQ